MKFPSFIFAVLCASCIFGAGFSGDYLCKNGLPTKSSTGATMAFIILSVYFLYVGIRQLTKENKEIDVDEIKKIR